MTLSLWIFVHCFGGGWTFLMYESPPDHVLEGLNTNLWGFRCQAVYAGLTEPWFSFAYGWCPCLSVLFLMTLADLGWWGCYLMIISGLLTISSTPECLSSSSLWQWDFICQDVYNQISWELPLKCGMVLQISAPLEVDILLLVMRFNTLTLGVIILYT